MDKGGASTLEAIRRCEKHVGRAEALSKHRYDMPVAIEHCIQAMKEMEAMDTREETEYCLLSRTVDVIGSLLEMEKEIGKPILPENQASELLRALVKAGKKDDGCVHIIRDYISIIKKMYKFSQKKKL